MRKQIDQIFLELRDLQKEVAEKIEKMDRATFLKTASDLAAELVEKYNNDKIKSHIQDMIEDMADNLKIFSPQNPISNSGFTPDDARCGSVPTL